MFGEAPAVEPPAPTLRRITSSQYERIVVDLFGDDITVPPEIEPDVRLSGFIAIGAGAATVSSRGVERYEDAAYQIASEALGPERRDRILACTPADVVDPDCAASFFTSFGKRVWRRPLTDEEVAVLVDISGTAAETVDDFHGGLEFGLATLLQSPDFIFRAELGEADPDAGGFRYTAYEMASRLSFLFWDTAPDEELLRAAEAGELLTVDGVDAQADRLLASERSREGVRAWFTDMLELDELDSLNKDPDIFIHMTDTVGESAAEETLLGLEYVVFTDDGDFRDILTTRRTFVNRELAAIYNVRAPSRDGFAETMLPDDQPRVGIMGQASFLAMRAHPVSTSPTLRGLFIRERLLCQLMPDPPSGVDTSIPEPTTVAPTLRDRVAQHLEDPTCASCHQLTDPIGLAFEHFDGIGRYREVENGTPIDASGQLDGITFTDAEGLASTLRNNPAFTPCMVKNLHRYASGHAETDGEDAAIAWLAEVFADRGHRVQPLLLDLVSNDLFRTVGEVVE